MNNSLFGLPNTSAFFLLQDPSFLSENIEDASSALAIVIIFFDAHWPNFYLFEDFLRSPECICSCMLEVMGN